MGSPGSAFSHISSRLEDSSLNINIYSSNSCIYSYDYNCWCIHSWAAVQGSATRHVAIYQNTVWKCALRDEGLAFWAVYVGAVGLLRHLRD